MSKRGLLLTSSRLGVSRARVHVCDTQVLVVLVDTQVLVVLVDPQVLVVLVDPPGVGGCGCTGR